MNKNLVTSKLLPVLNVFILTDPAAWVVLV